MRRFKQQMTEAECSEILERNTSGVLSIIDGDVPYGVPLSYVAANGKIYFHCALSGRKTDALMQCPSVSFCIIDKDEIIPEKFTTYFKSVIVSGSISFVTDMADKERYLGLIADRFSPGIDGKDAEVGGALSHVTILELNPTSITGKKAIELV